MRIIEWSAFSVQLRRESKQKSGGFDCQALRGVGRGVAKGVRFGWEADVELASAHTWCGEKFHILRL